MTAQAKISVSTIGEEPVFGPMDVGRYDGVDIELANGETLRICPTDDGERIKICSTALAGRLAIRPCVSNVVEIGPFVGRAAP